MGNGLHLSWGKVLTLVLALVAFFWSNMTLADNQQEEAIKAVAKEIKVENVRQDKQIFCKLETKDFMLYKRDHNEDYQRLVREVRESRKELSAQMFRSEKEIVRILTRMEKSR